jgi:hypothetical protein
MPNFGRHREGESGSINLFYKGVYLSQFPLDSLHTFDILCKESLKILNEKQVAKLPLKKKLFLAKAFIETTMMMVKCGNRIKAQDQILILHTMLMLIQFKVIDNDELNGYLICKKYKGKKKKRINNLK